jgi:hypothetical protein
MLSALRQLARTFTGRPRLHRCAHCRQVITGSWISSGETGTSPRRWHYDRPDCRAAASRQAAN